jgi:type II secretory pathway pseudopilin PulG
MFASTNDRAAPTSQRGFTLLEMILFIVVLGIAGVALLSVLSSPLTGAGAQTEAVTATQLAQGRMELVLGQKRREGFPGSDPCTSGSPPGACQLPSNWTVTTEFVAWDSNPDTETYQVIVVTANGPGGGSHTIRTLVTRLGGGG